MGQRASSMLRKWRRQLMIWPFGPGSLPSMSVAGP